MSIVNEADLKGLRSLLERQKGEIDALGKFKEECGGAFNAVITQLNKKISVLSEEVAANQRIADMVLIEVKALFASSLARI